MLSLDPEKIDVFMDFSFFEESMPPNVAYLTHRRKFSCCFFGPFFIRYNVLLADVQLFPVVCNIFVHE